MAYFNELIFLSLASPALFLFQPPSSTQLFINPSSLGLQLCSILTVEFSCCKVSAEREVPFVQPWALLMLLNLDVSCNLAQWKWHKLLIWPDVSQYLTCHLLAEYL